MMLNISNIYFFSRNSHFTEPGNKPLVSVILPVRNEERGINECLESLIRAGLSQL